MSILIKRYREALRSVFSVNTVPSLQINCAGVCTRVHEGYSAKGCQHGIRKIAEDILHTNEASLGKTFARIPGNV